EFLASPDSWFRPVFATTGPDGALYVCDMYRKIIDHPLIFPEDARPSLDFSAGKDRGRIWRITAADRSTPRTATLAGADTRGLCNRLSDPNGWTRDTARRMLLERRDASATSILGSLLKQSDDATARLYALRTLQELQALADEQILEAWDDPHPAIR